MNIQNYIAKRFQHAGSGLSLDTEALAKYSDIIDLSIGDTDFTTDEAIIERHTSTQRRGTPITETRRATRS